MITNNNMNTTATDLSIFSRYYVAFATLSGRDFEEIEKNVVGTSYNPQTADDPFAKVVQDWFDYQIRVLRELINQQQLSSSEVGERAASVRVEGSKDEVSVNIPISKKKRLIPSQPILPTQQVENNSSLAFSSTAESSSDLRKELLEKKSSLVYPTSPASDRLKAAIIPQLEKRGDLNRDSRLLSPNNDASNARNRQLDSDKILIGTQRLAKSYSLLILKQRILLSTFLDQFMLFINLDFNVFNQLHFDGSSSSQPLPPALYFINQEFVKTFLEIVIQSLIVIFKCFGSIILRNLLKYPIIIYSKRSFTLLKDITDSIENEFPSQFNSFSSNKFNQPLQSFVRPTFTSEDNRLEQKTKIEKDSYTERETFYEDLCNLFARYYELYYKFYDATLLEKFVQKEMKEFIRKMNNTKARNMKSFAKLFIQMYLHYSIQLMTISNPVPVEERLPVDKTKLMKLENRLLPTPSSAPTPSSKRSSTATSTSISTEFPQFLSFFSTIISLSTHFLFYHYLIQLTLSEIEQLVSQRRYNNSFSLRASMVASEGFIDQFTDVGIIHEDEKNSIFLMKLMKLAQLLGYVYSLFPTSLEESGNNNNNDEEGYGSPTSPSVYQFTNSLPLCEILEKSLKDNTRSYTIIWILGFLNAVMPSTSQFKDVLVLLYTIQKNEKYLPINDQFSTIEFLIIIQLQEFWRKNPSLLKEIPPLISTSSTKVVKQKFYQISEQSEWNTIILNEKIIHFVVPTIAKCLALPTRTQPIVKERSSIPPPSQPSFSAAIQSSINTLPTHSKPVKRQTPSVIQRQPSIDPTTYLGNIASIGTFESNNNVNSPRIAVSSTDNSTSIPKQTKNSSTPKLTRAATIDSALHIQTLSYKDPQPPPPSACPPSPTTSVNSLANLSIVSNPSVSQPASNGKEKTSLMRSVSTASYQASANKSGILTGSTSKSQKLNKSNLQQHEDLINNNFGQSKKSPYISPLMRQRSQSITDASLNSVRTQLFVGKEGNVVSANNLIRSNSIQIRQSQLTGYDEVPAPTLSQKNALLQSMEHAFWQRHRYLYEVHVFLHSNSYRIIQTNITELVNQSCQKLLKEFTGNKDDSKDRKYVNQGESKERKVLQYVYDEALEKGKVFFQEFYTNTVKTQLPLLYEHHLIPLEVKKLSIYYTQKQLYELFTHRKKYFQQYCLQKLQQLMDKYLEMKQRKGFNGENSLTTRNGESKGRSESVGDEENEKGSNMKTTNLSMWRFSDFLRGWVIDDSRIKTFLTPLFELKNDSTSRENSFTIPSFTSLEDLFQFFYSFNTIFVQLIELFYQLQILLNHYQDQKEVSISWKSSLSSSFAAFLLVFKEFNDKYSIWSKVESDEIFGKCEKILRTGQYYGNSKSDTGLLLFMYQLLVSYFGLLQNLKESNPQLLTSSAFGKLICEFQVVLPLILPYILSIDYLLILHPLLSDLPHENQDQTPTFVHTAALRKMLFQKSNDKKVNVSQSKKLLMSSIASMNLTSESFTNLIDILSRKRINAFYENCKRVDQAQQLLPLLSLVLGSLYIQYNYSDKLTNVKEEILSNNLLEEKIIDIIGNELFNAMMTIFVQYVTD